MKLGMRTQIVSLPLPQTVAIEDFALAFVLSNLLRFRATAKHAQMGKTAAGTKSREGGGLDSIHFIVLMCR